MADLKVLKKNIKKTDFLILIYKILNNVFTFFCKINKCLIEIIREYLITKEKQFQIQKVLFDPPSVLSSVNRYSSIKSQSLQFRLTKIWNIYRYIISSY